MSRDSSSVTQQPAASLTVALARHCRRPVTPEARARAALHLTDWLGCAAIGAAQPEAKALFSGFALPQPATASAAGSFPADPWQALLFQAAVGNMLEMDDLYKQGLVHPAPVVIPAALFMTQRLGLDGTALLDAIVRGYEAMSCLGRSVGPGHYRFWHNTATCGPAGAAAAVCSLMGLDETQWVHAFGHAITQSAGLWQVRLEPGLSKQWHNARAAQTGVQAALLARADAAAPQRILEGEKGFYAAMCPDAAPERLLVSGESGAAAAAHDSGGPEGHQDSGGQDGNHAVGQGDAGDWQILLTSLKPWAACRHSHATIDCALDLHEELSRQRIDASSIQFVRVRSYADALSFCDRPEPGTPIQARFSLQHAAAVTLLYGAPAMDAFEEKGLSDPHVGALRQRVSVALHPELDAAYPEHFGAEIELSLDDGRVLQCLHPDAWGDPERPMDGEAVKRKGHMLLEVSTGTQDNADLVDFAMQLHTGQADAQALQAWISRVNTVLERLPNPLVR